MYEFNGTLYRSNENVTLTFNVALNNLSNFLELVGKRKKKLNQSVLPFYGSSKAYQGKKIIIECSAWSMFNLMIKLGCKSDSEVRDNIHVNYQHLVKIKNKTLPMVLIWSKTKGYYTQFRNTLPTYTSVYANGRHIVPIR